MGLTGVIRKHADSKVEQLRRAPLFSQCSKAELQFLASRMDDMKAGSGTVLTTHGVPGHTFYLVLEGEVEAAIEGEVRAVLKAGDFFGEISMLDRGPATATCTARTDVEMLVMSHQQFRDAVKSNEAVLASVLGAMAQRQRANEGAGFLRPELPPRG